MKFQFILIILSLTLIGCGNDTNKKSNNKKMNALLTCQESIKNILAMKSYPPHTKDWGSPSDDEYYFSWGKSKLENNNSASCDVKKSTGKITSLTINGKQII